METIPKKEEGKNKYSITALLTSVDFSDILELTLRHNKPLFKKILVITSPQDGNTQAVCKNLDVECLVSDGFAPGFNKGAAINEGLALLKQEGWLMITDADIFWPPDFKEMLPFLHPQYLYGFHRRVIKKSDIGLIWVKNDIPEMLEDIDPLFLGGDYSKMATIEEMKNKLPHDSFGMLQKSTPYKYIEKPETFSAMGWNSNVESSPDNPLPLGYGQLFYRPFYNFKYPVHFDTACGCDTYFSSQWPEEKRKFVPGFTTLHLGPRYVHWTGRKLID